MLGAEPRRERRGYAPRNAVLSRNHVVKLEKDAAGLARAMRNIQLS